MVGSIYLALDESILFKQEIKQTADMESLGKVTNSSNVVKRKYAKDLNWYSLSNNDDIFESDSIFTEQNADAEITFTDGSKLFIEPATMLIITRKNNQSLVDIRKGSISSQLTKGNKLAIKTEAGQTQEVVGDNSQIQINVGETGKAKLTVLSGDVKVKSGDKKEQTIAKNQVATIDDQGEIKDIEMIPIVLSTPASDKIMWKVPSDNVVNFSWLADSSLQKQVLEVALNKEFSKMVKALELTSGTQSAEISGLPDQKTLYWRVRGELQGKKQSSVVSRFKIYFEVPPRPVFPKNQAIISFTNAEIEGDDKNLVGTYQNLRWTDAVQAMSYQVMISSEAEFKNKQQIVLAEMTKEMGMRTKKIPAGVYYWKVRANDPSRPEARWSEVFTFTLQKKQTEEDLMNLLSMQKLPAPTAAESTNIPHTSKGPDGKVIPGSLRDVPLLKWNKVEGAEKYQIQLSSDREFAEETLVKKEVVENQLVITTEKAGTYYWKVAGINKAQKVGNFSAMASFLIKEKARAPELTAPEIAEEKREQSLEFLDLAKLQWQAVKNADHYLLEVASDENFGQLLLQEKTEQTAWTLKLENNTTHYWRVQARSKARPPIPASASPYSAMARIEVKKIIKAPLIMNNNVRVPVNEKMVIEWAPVKLTKQYLVQFATDDDFDKVKTQTLPASTTRAESPFNKAGTYFVRVAAISEDKQQGPFSKTFSYTLYLVLEAPEIVFAREDDPPYFVWKKNPLAHHYQLYFTKAGTDKSIVKEIEGNHFKLEKFPKGNYDWKIRAVSEDGYQGKWSVVRKFVINNPGRMAICQKKMDVDDLSSFNLEKISIDDDTGCMIVDK